MKAHEHVILEIARERERQMTAEGWGAEHDDGHNEGEMSRAASLYAAHASAMQRVETSLKVYASVDQPLGWPWARKWWKPNCPRRDLVKAAALIVAEIERLDRAEAADAA